MKFQCYGQNALTLIISGEFILHKCHHIDIVLTAWPDHFFVPFKRINPIYIVIARNTHKLLYNKSVKKLKTKI